MAEVVAVAADSTSGRFVSGKAVSGLMAWALFLSLTCLVSCSQRDPIGQQANSQDFVQNYIPQNLDILWVVDSRSDLYPARDHIVSEATSLFSNLDNLATQDELVYQMGITTGDMAYNKGQLLGTPAILKNDVGTSDERTQLFGDALTNNVLNLRTGGEYQAFAAALASLQGPFPPRSDAALALIFISDADDASTTPDGSDPVKYYTSQFLSLKNNQSSALHVYSINYVPSSTPGFDASTERCATEFNADIDKQQTYRMSELTQALGGQTADLCGDFSSQINLNGLAQGTPQTSFQLNATPAASSISVTVSTTDGSTEQMQEGQDWTYDASTNSIVFRTPPPQGARIHVAFHI